MRKIFFILLLAVVNLSSVYANEPNNGYLFAYGTNSGDGRGGLYFAWSIDNENWHPIGNSFSFLNSDYGAWGSQKRMYDPVLVRDKDGLWHCVWTLNDEEMVVSYTTSTNLTYWKPQSYPHIGHRDGNCNLIEIKYNSQDNDFILSWIDSKNGNNIFSTKTSDFKSFGTINSITQNDRLNQRDTIVLNGGEFVGTKHEISWDVIDHLIKTKDLVEYKNMLYSETMRDDDKRFAGLNSLESKITIRPEKSKKISDMLIGAFFEDINYAADGGIYAELVRNRDFEFSNKDQSEWNAKTGWEVVGNGLTFDIETSLPIHENNKHYAVLSVNEVGGSIVNDGYDGICINKGEKYNLSLFARAIDGKKQKVKIRLTDNNGNVIGETSLSNISSNWKKHSATITATSNSVNSKLEIIPQNVGQIALDMISLFPQNTFKGRRNGLRADLAQVVADMKPKFIRFPGGCLAHGDGIDNIYNWKNTIGPLESRVQDRNIWGYHQTMGLGYFEYFQFCMDIGAEPLPVLAAGVPCQNSRTGGHGQQCGIPMEQMGDYIQDIFDLIEWANGNPKTNQWAKKRAEAGHPEPFNLKYIGIGNEDLISDVFEERFKMIVKAIQEKYPDIIIVGTSGPFYEGSDYTEGWRISTETNIELVDEHYYVQPGWFIHNQDYYDRYDRSKPKVYLGEYASHGHGRRSTLEVALTEALHLANVERNGDVVSLTSYAPLFGKEGRLQWTPDLIYFNNSEVKPTTSYYVQKLYGQNAGDEYLPTNISLSDTRENVRKRVSCSIVKDSETGDYIVKLLNLLPTEINTTIDIEPLNITNSEAMVTILTGEPSQENLKPQTTKIDVSELSGYKIPAYSFIIVRVK